MGRGGLLLSAALWLAGCSSTGLVSELDEADFVRFNSYEVRLRGAAEKLADSGEEGVAKLRTAALEESQSIEGRWVCRKALLGCLERICQRRRAGEDAPGIEHGLSASARPRDELERLIELLEHPSPAVAALSHKVLCELGDPRCGVAVLAGVQRTWREWQASAARSKDRGWRVFFYEALRRAAVWGKRQPLLIHGVGVAPGERSPATWRPEFAALWHFASRSRPASKGRGVALLEGWLDSIWSELPEQLPVKTEDFGG